MKAFKKYFLFAISPLVVASTPLISLSCTNHQNPVANKGEILNSTLTKITNWFNNYPSFAFQYFLPTQAQFFSTYVPDLELINGFKMTNINWNFKNDDHLGQKTIQFDLDKNDDLKYYDQQITIKGFLNVDQAKLQTDHDQLKWSKQLINYRHQSANWIATGVGILNNPWLNQFDLQQLLNDPQQNDLKTIINRLITTQAIKINQVQQFNYQNIPTNAIELKFSLVASDGKVGNPLKVLITNLKPDPQPQSNVQNQLNAWKQALINNDIKISSKIKNTNISQFLEQLKTNPVDWEDMFEPNGFNLFTNNNHPDRYRHRVWLAGEPTVVAIDWTNLSVEFDSEIVYQLLISNNIHQFQQRYSQPIRFRLFFRS